MAGASSGSRPVFPWISAFTSPMLGPPGASSADRKAEVSEEKPWLNAQEPLLSPWSGNLYRQGVRDPGEQKRKDGWKGKLAGTSRDYGCRKGQKAVLSPWPLNLGKLYFDSTEQCWHAPGGRVELLKIQSLNLKGSTGSFCSPLCNKRHSNIFWSQRAHLTDADQLVLCFRMKTYCRLLAYNSVLNT